MLSKVELLEVVCGFWADFFGVSVAPQAGGVLPRRDLVSGLARYEGDFSGGIALTMSLAHARQLAANLYLMPIDDVADQDVDDLMNELISIVADIAAARSRRDCRLKRTEIMRSGQFGGELSAEDSGVSIILQSDAGPVFVRLF